MKLVFETHSKSEAIEVKLLLENNGIPASLSGENMNSIRKYIGGSLGVWVYLDEQVEEARRLIDNPAYEVINPVKVSEFYRVANSDAAKEKAILLILKMSGLAFGALISVILIIFVIHKLQT